MDDGDMGGRAFTLSELEHIVVCHVSMTFARTSLLLHSGLIAVNDFWVEAHLYASTL